MIQKIQEYLNQRLLLLRLEVTEKLSKALAAFIKHCVLLVLFTIFFVFASIALALYIGEIFDSDVLGFLTVGGGFLVLFILAFLMRKPLIEKPFVNKIIRILFEKNHEKEENTSQ